MPLALNNVGTRTTYVRVQAPIESLRVALHMLSAPRVSGGASSNAWTSSSFRQNSGSAPALRFCMYKTNGGSEHGVRIDCQCCRYAKRELLVPVSTILSSMMMQDFLFWLWLLMLLWSLLHRLLLPPALLAPTVKVGVRGLPALALAVACAPALAAAVARAPAASAPPAPLALDLHRRAPKASAS